MASRFFFKLPSSAAYFAFGGLLTVGTYASLKYNTRNVLYAQEQVSKTEKFPIYGQPGMFCFYKFN